MKHFLASILLTCLLCTGFSCVRSTPGSDNQPKAAAAVKTAQPSIETTKTESLSEAAETPAKTIPDAKEDKGIFDTILVILRSIEAIITGIIALLAAIGVAAKAIITLKKANKALNTIAETIEEFTVEDHDGKEVVHSLTESISRKAPQKTPVGAFIHKYAMQAKAKVRNGK